MTLKAMQIFVTVAECGNMTKAAEKLFISQPSVSLTISEIEKEYDIILFERLRGKLQLTHTGEMLLRYAKRMLDMERELEYFLNHEPQHSLIRVGATITVGSSIMAPIIAQIRITMPNVNYHVHVANTHIIEDMLVNGELDIAIVEGEIKSPNLEVKSIIYDRLVLICSNKHPFHSRATVHIDELANQPLILREPQSGTREQFESVMRQSSIDFTVRWSSYSYVAIIDAVEHNLGVSVISELLVRKYIKTGSFSMCNIIGADFGRSFKLVYHKHKYITQAISEFLQICYDGSLLENGAEI